MISSAALSLSNVPPTPATATGSESKPGQPVSEPLSPTEPHVRKMKSSPRLSRWSRARAVRSGKKLGRAAQKPVDPNSLVDVIVDSENSLGSELQTMSSLNEGGSDGEATAAKSIYMVSDATGWTVENSVNAALGQFEHCLVDRNCAVNTHLFSGIDDVKRLMEVIAQAAKEGAMLVYTLADPSMAEAARQACDHWGVTSLDVLGPITEAIAAHLGVSPSGLSRWAPGRKSTLSDEYFKRIEAVEFTIKQDDGALPENLRNADIILTGVSRTGKTPLSIYLAQKGYKVANVPIVINMDLPRSLFEVDPEKVFALTINPVVLHSIRRARAKTMGFGEDTWSTYSDMESVRQELDYASKIFQRNPIWPVIEVTGKAIEETAAFVLRLYHDRKNRCSMPRISKRY